MTTCQNCCKAENECDCVEITIRIPRRLFSETKDALKHVFNFNMPGSTIAPQAPIVNGGGAGRLPEIKGQGSGGILPRMELPTRTTKDMPSSPPKTISAQSPTTKNSLTCSKCGKSKKTDSRPPPNGSYCRPCMRAYINERNRLKAAGTWKPTWSMDARRPREPSIARGPKRLPKPDKKSPASDKLQSPPRNDGKPIERITDRDKALKILLRKGRKYEIDRARKQKNRKNKKLPTTPTPEIERFKQVPIGKNTKGKWKMRHVGRITDSKGNSHWHDSSGPA